MPKNSASISGAKRAPPERRHNPAPELRQLMESAIVHQRSGRAEEALAQYRKIMAQDPAFPDAFHFAGLAAHALGEEEQARTWLATAERLAPGRLDFLLNASRFFQEIGAPEEAETRAAQARRIAPRDPRAIIQYADSLLKLDRGDEITGELETLARAYPRDTGIWLLLARSRLQGGYRAQAHADFERACQGVNDTAIAHLEFAEFLRENKKTAAANEHYDWVLKNGDAAQRALAQCGLSAIAAQTGDRAAAFRHASEALENSADAYHAWPILVGAGDESELERLRPRLEKARATASPPDDFALDFALGSLLERLGDYPAAWTAYVRGNQSRRRSLHYDPAQHTDFFAAMCRYVGRDFLTRHGESGNPSELPVFIVGMPRSGTTLVERALGGHPAVREGGEMTVVADILRRRSGAGDRHRLPAWIAQRTSAEIREIAEEWLAALQQEAQGATRLIDKLPSNFAYIGLIRACFPNATVIHMKRDPRDVFVSSWTTMFDASLAYCYDPEEFKVYYSGYRSMMEHWARVGSRRKFIEIEYEKLVENFDETIAHALDTIGLDWHPDCARFSSRSGSVGTASWFQVRRPLYTSSVARWQRFRKQLGPLAELQTWLPEKEASFP